jgi:hypothetical protein
VDFGSFFATYFAAILIFNALLAFIPAYIAREKGRSFGAFWALSFFTTIFVGLIAVLALPQMEKEVRTVRTDEHGKVLAHETEIPEAIKCPFCAEFVKSEASICRFCQKDISKHVDALKAQIAKNVEGIARETAAREREIQKQAEADYLAEIERVNERSAKIRKISRSPVTISVGVGAVLAAIGWYGISTYVSANEAAQTALAQEQTRIENDQKQKDKEQQQQDAAIKIEGQLAGCLKASEYAQNSDGSSVALLTNDLRKLDCATAALLESTELPDELVKFVNKGLKGAIGSRTKTFYMGNGYVEVMLDYGTDFKFKIFLSQ